MKLMISRDSYFKAYIVYLILNGNVEYALNLLSKYHNISPPRVRVKRVKGCSRALAVYSLRDKTIYIQSGEYYSNPFVILHEYYHHLRNYGGVHRGTEYKADEYALDFINEYRRVVKSLLKESSKK